MLPDFVKLPRQILVDDRMILRQIERRHSFEAAVSRKDIQRYITWVALAAQSPQRSPIEGLREYSGGTLRGRYAIELDNRLAGYMGCTQGTENGVLSISYFTVTRGQRLAERAVQAFTALSLPNVNGFELTIADDNIPSQRVANACGFTATEQFIRDEVLQLDERVYRKPFVKE